MEQKNQKQLSTKMLDLAVKSKETVKEFISNSYPSDWSTLSVLVLSVVGLMKPKKVTHNSIIQINLFHF
ncbi:hypothetical protein [Clostridium sp.]|uniref:hypothetical protein n=1 Tax=Clostridium sp. TaxID=1506 RepID=UPI00283EB60B|nr:hypothetical protein [Clostridium sp.]MDR3595053.1 hypothetical protein [Clostridium sp.]